jgi:hypothetical protein
LPGAELSALSHDIEAVRAAPPFEMQVSKLHFTGKGMLFYIESPPLLDMHRKLASRWDKWLIPQDRQGYKPHIVVQNKTLAEQAKVDFLEMQSNFRPMVVRAESLVLWQYLHGPWQLEQVFPF